MKRVLFCILSILIIIASCFTVAGAQSDDPSKPSLEYWDQVWNNIQLCTYYTYTGEAPPPDPSVQPNLTSDRKPQSLEGLYENGIYSADLNPQNLTDLDFYKSNYNSGSFNAAYYFDIPLNLKSGSISFAFEYYGMNDLNYYTSANNDRNYFTSFRDMLLSGITEIKCYAYDSNLNYRELLEPEFYTYNTIDTSDCYSTFIFNIDNIVDLSFIKLVFKLKTNDTYYDGNSVQNISGKIPFYHKLVLPESQIYVPPTYDDLVLEGIGEVKNQLDSMLFPDNYVSGQVTDLNNKLDSTEQKVDDLNAGLEIDDPVSFDQFYDFVSPYYNILDFNLANKSIGRFWNASVIMRMLMITGFFAYISFILFGKKA